SIIRCRLRAIESTPRLHSSGAISCITALISACAATCAIPAPICPAPMTPICCKLIRLSETYSAVNQVTRERILMMPWGLLTTDPRAGAATASHRGAHLPYILGRLAPRHPEVAHQEVRHVRGEPVADGWLGADLRVEHRIDLLPRETLRHENIDQPGQSDFAAGAVHDRDYFRTRRADAADQTGALAAIDASHQEINRLKVSIASAPECIAGPASPKKPRKNLKRPCARKIGGPASFLRLLPVVDRRKHDRATRLRTDESSPLTWQTVRVTFGIENHSQN